MRSLRAPDSCPSSAERAIEATLEHRTLVAYTQITLELPDDLLERIDRQIGRIRQHDLLVSRGNIIALLLGTALDDAESLGGDGQDAVPSKRGLSSLNQLLADLESQRVAALHRRRVELEHDAPSLRELAPTLLELSYRVFRRLGPSGDRTETPLRQVEIDRAKAYFFDRCVDGTCVGGHDLSEQVCRGLRKRQTSIVAQVPCAGGSLITSCPGVLELEASARYQAL